MPQRRIRLVVLSIIVVFTATAVFVWRGHRNKAVEISASPKPETSRTTSAPAAVAPVTPKSGTSTALTAFDYSNWKTLKNKNGWSIQYPPQWEASSLGNNAIESDTAPYFDGPAHCYDTNQACGYVSISLWTGPPVSKNEVSNLNSQSPKEFLLATEFPIPPDPEESLLQQGDVTIASLPAYYIIVRQKNF